MSPRSGTPRISRRAFAAGSLASGVLLAGSHRLLAQDATPVAPAPAATGPEPEVLVTGLLDPRFLAVDGTDLYFTESGSGGDQPAAITMGEGTPEPEVPFSMTGNTGKLSRLSADGTVTELVSDFRSYTFGEQGEIVGAAGLALDGGGYAFVAVGSPGPFVGQLTLTGEEGVVYAVDLATGEKTVLADLVSYEIANNPDPAAIDSNLYGLALMDGQLYVCDAGGNDVLQVDPASGAVSTFAVTGGLDAPFFPDSGNPARGGAKEIDSVPSTIVAGADGLLYQSFITGGPFPPGLAPVYTYSADGTQSVFAEGLTMVQSLAFDSAGNLYACIMSADFMTMAPGQVVQVSADGNHTVVVDGLMLPAGIAFDAEDNLYVVNKCTGIPGGGEILKYTGVVGGASDTQATPVTSGDTSNVFEVTLVNGEIQPAEMTIPADTDVTFAVTNNGTFGHDFTLEGLDMTTGLIDPEASADLMVNLPAGTYVYYCSVPGHREAGMQGTLTVEAGAAKAAPVSGGPVHIWLNDATFEPSVITVPADVDVELVLENRGYMMHDLVVESPKYVSKALGNGQSTSMIVNLPAGEHAIYCSQIGHRQMGMTGTIIAK